MDLRRLQARKRAFELARGWNRFPPSLVYTHLVEELGEIGSHILFREGYKVRGLGHSEKRGVEREFAQVFSLFVQLANRFDIDLEACYAREFRIMQKRFSPTKWRQYMTRYRAPKPARATASQERGLEGRG